jgi:hypothetical protein
MARAVVVLPGWVKDVVSPRRVGALIALATLAGAPGCGASEPRESDIYHDPALRPTVLEATESDRAFLATLRSSDAEAELQIDGRTVGPAYHAASGWRCRAIGGQGPRLACELPSGEWGFVPHIATQEPPR